MKINKELSDNITKTSQVLLKGATNFDNMQKLTNK